MSVSRSVVISGIAATAGLLTTAWAINTGTLMPAKATGLCGLWFDIIGALVLGVGLLFPPSKIRTQYGGRSPMLEAWFAEGKRDARFGLALIVLGFIGQLVGGILA
jgi:hypothetical protein